MLRRGDAAEQTARIAVEAGATTVHVAAGLSAFARRREAHLRRLFGERLTVHDAWLTVVPPGRVTPAGRDHYAVFTPYHRAWQQAPHRTVLGAPRVLRTPDGLHSDDPPTVLNPLRQADRYDPDGAYVRRWPPELAHLPGPTIHRRCPRRGTPRQRFRVRGCASPG